MKVTRRQVLGTGAAAAVAMTMAPTYLRAQGNPGKTLRVVLHQDLVGFDPILTSSNISAYHGALVYDTLLGNDEDQQPQPQMVDTWSHSDDYTVWTFTLRDGLKFSDGSPVTTADVIPSIQRWGANSGLGKRLLAITKKISATDAKTFVITLTEPFRLVPDFLGSPVVPLCYIMPERAAKTDPTTAIDYFIGSGPFILNMAETKIGAQYVYDKNPLYVPRSEPVNGLAGGKVVRVDRVLVINMPDAQTAIAALQAGEIDFYEVPPTDFLPMLEGDSNLVIDDIFKVGTEGYVALNWLQPPFNNQKIRQAMLYAVDQEAVLKASYADPRWYKAHGSWFTYGFPMANDANTDWFKAAPDPAKAKALLKEGGYDGGEVVILQTTDVRNMSNSATVIAQQMRTAGFNVRIDSIDWATLLQRRGNKGKPSEGGWHVFLSYFNGLTNSNPYLFQHMATTGEKGWFGWPSDELNEKLRADWMLATGLDERKAIARKIQENAWNVVPHMLFGHWNQPVAFRKNVVGLKGVPGVLPFWNVDKT
jgi:peptide/nickel transport system substrate-binding protein